MSNKSHIIAQLNDEHRRSGVYQVTPGCLRLNHDKFQELIRAVKMFKDFSEDNDPHNEHDFGEVVVDNMQYFWKIDYYDTNLEGGSEDPTDTTKTRRMLTIMTAEEY